jgi:hypothetical protein
MLTLHTLLSLAQQMARLVPAASDRFPRHTKPALSTSVERFGACPLCRKLVFVQFTSPEALAECPRCGRSIRSLEPPDPA